MKPHLPLGLFAWLIATAAVSFYTFSSSSDSSNTNGHSHSREYVRYTPAQQPQSQQQQIAQVDQPDADHEAVLLNHTEEPITLRYNLCATPGLVEASTDTTTPANNGATSPLSSSGETATNGSNDDDSADSAFSPVQAFSGTTFAAPSGSARAADTPVTASFEGNTLTIVSGQNAAVRMKDNAKTHNTNSYSREGNISVSSASGGRYSGGNAINNKTLTTINIQGGSSLYLYDYTTSGNDFNGTVNITNAGSSMAAIGSARTGAHSLQIGTLTGSGQLLLRGHNTSGTSTFTVSNNTFAGTVYMTSNGGTVQVNANGKGWQDATFDFTRNKAYSNSLLDTTGTEPAKQVLYLNGDSTVAALRNGTTQYAEITGNGHTLNVGTSSGSFTYGGATNDLEKLVKFGNSTQIFTSTIGTETLSIQGGTLGTHGGGIFTSVELSGGATWSVTDSTSTETLQLTYGSGATIAGGSSNVVWEAPSTLDVTGISGSAPFFTLSNLTLRLGSSLTLTGYSGAVENGAIINFATIGSGAGYEISDDFYIKHGSYAYNITAINNGGVLQFTLGEAFTPPVEPDIIANGILAIRISGSDGLTASGATSITRSGNFSTTYTHNNRGSANNAEWRSAGNAVSFWASEEFPASMNSNATYTDSGSDVVSGKIGIIQVDEGNALYIGHDYSAYNGIVHIEADNTANNHAVIAAYDSTYDEINIAHLQGSGDVLLRGHNSATTFSFGDASAFDGRIFMSSQNAAVNLNTAGQALANTVVDFTPTAYTTPFGSGSASKSTLVLNDDSTVGGLNNGSATKAAVNGNNHTLSVGRDNDETYNFGGTVNDLAALEKIGTNTQHFTGSISVDSISVNAGTLGTSGTLDAENLSIAQGATLSTSGTTNISALTLNGGATWVLSGSENIGTLTLTNGTGTIRGAGDDVTWTANTTFNVGTIGGTNAWLNLENLTFSFGNSLSLEGLSSELAAGTTINFATLGSGASYTGQSTVTVAGETQLYTLGVTTTKDNILLLTVTGVETRADLITEGIAAVFIENDGLTASGAAQITRSGNSSRYTYKMSNEGSANNAQWRTQNGVSLWTTNQFPAGTYTSNLSTDRGDDVVSGQQRVIQVDEGTALYLGGTAYAGLILAKDMGEDAYSVIAAYDTGTTNVSIAALEGSGDVLLRGHSANTTNFSVGDASKLQGRIFLSADNRIANLNVAGSGLSNSIIDFTPVAYDSVFSNGATAASAIHLTLTSDAHVGALDNGTQGKAIINGGGHTLTIGNYSDEVFSFEGAFNNLTGLVKVGTNRQVFEQGNNNPLEVSGGITIKGGVLAVHDSTSAATTDKTLLDGTPQINLYESAEFVLDRRNEDRGNDFMGKLNIVSTTKGGDRAILSTYEDMTNPESDIADERLQSLRVTELTGSGSLLLHGVNTDSRTETLFSFDVGDNFTGRLYMSSEGGDVKLSLGNARTRTWNTTVVDFSDVSYYGSTVTPSRKTLLLIGATDLAGLAGGDDKSYLEGDTGMLTLGNDSRNTYVYGGHSRLTSLTKTGTNTQAFTRATEISASTTIDKGLLEFRDGLNTRHITLNDGRLNVIGDLRTATQDTAYNPQLGTITINAGKLQVSNLLHAGTFTQNAGETSARELQLFALQQRGGSISVSKDATITGSANIGEQATMTVRGNLDLQGSEGRTTDTIIQGTLSVSGHMDASDYAQVTLQGGALHTKTADILTLNLYEGSSWTVSGTNNVSNLTLTANTGTESITLIGSGKAAAINMPDTITFNGYNLIDSNTPIFTVSGLKLNLGASITFNNLDLTEVNTFNYAGLGTGASYTGERELEITDGLGNMYAATVTDTNGLVQITINRTPFDAGNGDKMWVYSSAETGAPQIGKLGAEYDIASGSWINETEYLDKGYKMVQLQLTGNAELYVRSGDISNSLGILTSNISILPGEGTTQIHAENTAGYWDFRGHITGEGNLQLVAHNSNGATVFDFTNSTPKPEWFSGELNLVNPNGGAIQLNIGHGATEAGSVDSRWKNTVMNLTPTSMDSIYDADSEEGRAHATVLALEGNAQIKGLIGGAEGSGVTASGQFNLTLGSDKAEDVFIYNGTLGSDTIYTGGEYDEGSIVTVNNAVNNNLSITKIGANTQIFQGSNSLHHINMEGGKLTFTQALVADHLNLKVGELTTLGETTIDSANLNTSSIWNIGSNVTITDSLTLTGNNLMGAVGGDQAHILRTGELEEGAEPYVWTAPQRIELKDFARGENGPFLNIGEGISLSIQDNFTLTGFNAVLTNGQIINLAQLSSSQLSGLALGHAKVSSSHNLLYNAEVHIDPTSNILQLIITEVYSEVTAGHKMWVKSGADGLTGLNEATYNGDYNWNGKEISPEELNKIYLRGGSELYLVSDEHSDKTADYDGTLVLNPDGGAGAARLHAENTNAYVTFSGAVGGQGELQLVAHNQEGATVFDFVGQQEAILDGRLSVTNAEGGEVQLNMGNDRWRATVVDIGSFPIDSIYDADSTAESSANTIIALTGDASAKGIVSNSENAMLTTQGNYTLTLGEESGLYKYIYSGKVDGHAYYYDNQLNKTTGTEGRMLSLVKTGNNGQTFTLDAKNLYSVEMNGGTLEFQRDLQADYLTVNSGTIETGTLNLTGEGMMTESGVINALTINGGTLNSGDASIKSAVMYGGTFADRGHAVIDMLQMQGGVIDARELTAYATMIDAGTVSATDATLDVAMINGGSITAGNMNITGIMNMTGGDVHAVRFQAGNAGWVDISGGTLTTGTEITGLKRVSEGAQISTLRVSGGNFTSRGLLIVNDTMSVTGGRATAEGLLETKTLELGNDGVLVSYNDVYANTTILHGDDDSSMDWFLNASVAATNGISISTSATNNSTDVAIKGGYIFKDLDKGTVDMLGQRGANVVWSTPLSMDFTDSGLTKDSNIFSFTHMGFTLGGVTELKLPYEVEAGDIISFAQFGENGKYVDIEGGRFIITDPNTSKPALIGTVISDPGGARIKFDVAEEGQVGAGGFIWSGSTSTTSSCAPGLVLGNTWRADYSAEGTGWHEQSNGAGAGVFVNGSGAIFADTDMHGNEVVQDARKVMLQTNTIYDSNGMPVVQSVAPGTIFVTADENKGFVTRNDDDTEARMWFGYAFIGSATEGLTDVYDSQGNMISQTGIVKTGDALLVLSAYNTFSGNIDVQDGGIFMGEVNALGYGTLKVHSDQVWNLPVYANQTNSNAGDRTQTVNNSLQYDLYRRGAEILVCCNYSDEMASGFRQPTITNDIVMVDTGLGEYNNNQSALGSYATGNHLSISFAYSTFHGANSNLLSVPRHWRQLTMSGALQGTGNDDDVLHLIGYSSSWYNNDERYQDQSYVCAFIMNDSTATGNRESTFSGTVVMENTINTSPLESNRTGKRTGGTVQLNLSDNKLQYAVLDMTRHSVTGTELSALGINDSGTRQTYNDILVLKGDVGLRGLEADFIGSAWKHWMTQTATSGSAGSYGFGSIAQHDEVWHVRAVAEAASTLTLGEHEKDASRNYVFSGALGFRQSYAGAQDAHVMYGDGFDEAPTNTDNTYIRDRYSDHMMGETALSLVKDGAAGQFIHSAELINVAVKEGTLGFNNLSVSGNVDLTGGSTLALGVYQGKTDTQTGQEFAWSQVTNWDNITTDTSTGANSLDYQLNKTTAEITVAGGKTFRIFTPTPTAGILPTAAVVDGNINMAEGSTLSFVVENADLWSKNIELTNIHAPSENVLLNVNGTLKLTEDSNDIDLNFSGVNFALSPFASKTYYLAEADAIQVGNEDATAFAKRLISLGQGYFGTLTTINDAQFEGANRDYLVMNVLSDPRNTWSGMIELNGNNIVWEHSDSVEKAQDYRWKENTVFRNGNIVFFGNLYTPDEWTEASKLTSDESVRVQTGGVLSGDVENLDDELAVLDGQSYDPTMAGRNPLMPGTVQEHMLIDDFDEGTELAAYNWQTVTSNGTEVAINNRFGLDYQKVQINDEVAPLSLVINTDYLDMSNNAASVCDGTNYYFFGDGLIRNATAEELKEHAPGTNWETNLEKYGTGTAVIATANTFTGGTLLEGGRIVMQNRLALGLSTYDEDYYGDGYFGKKEGNECGIITISNAATLQGDFADDRTADYWPHYGEAYTGEGMTTTTIENTVFVKDYMNGSALTFDTDINANLTNAHDMKLVLVKLSGESNTVVTLRAMSVAPEEAIDGKYTYGVYKVLDPGGFSGTIRMDGNLWGKQEYSYDPAKVDQLAGGRVQLEIMTTAKANTTTVAANKDWTRANIDLSVNNGTERTVLALDPIEKTSDGTAQSPDTMQYAYVNTLMGTSDTRMEDGAINSSVVNMSERNPLTLVLTGSKDGDYDGVLGYGSFQQTTDYGYAHADAPEVGQENHHYGNGEFGNLSIQKEGNTSQSVYNAWINVLDVNGGTFKVDHVLLVSDMQAGALNTTTMMGAGQRIMVGEVTNPNTVYSLTVGNNGILAMDNAESAASLTGTKVDAWANVGAGTKIESNGTFPAAWVQLQDGATITAHQDWYTAKQVEIETGSAVTFNAHVYNPDAYITSAEDDANHGNEYGDHLAHSQHLNQSRIIQLLGNMSGNNLNLLFNNDQMSAGATAEELGKADFMGYIALQDHNQMTGRLTVTDHTVLQILNNHSEANTMNAVVEGEEAAMQMVKNGNQYVNNLSVGGIGGALILGGAEKTSLTGNYGVEDRTGTLRQDHIDYDQEAALLTVEARTMDGVVKREEGNYGTMTNVHTTVNNTNHTASIGGTAYNVALCDVDGMTEAHDVHITVHNIYGTAPTDATIHHTHLHNSLVELEENCSTNMQEQVLIKQNSIVFGTGTTLNSGSGMVVETLDFKENGSYNFYMDANDKANEYVNNGVKPNLASATTITGVNTTVEMTFDNNRKNYHVGTSSAGQSIDFYHVKVDQFQGVNVDGSGLTIQLQDALIWYATEAGAEFIAIQVGGEEDTGRFMFEDEAGNFDFADGNRYMFDENGKDITLQWVSSSEVNKMLAELGINVDPVSHHMLYFVVPEPTTATLSILALAALAARRRRKQD